MQVGEFIELAPTISDDAKLFEVTAVGHKYNEVHRNATTIFVKPGKV